jgi:DNA-binding MarR family transcriptional regulator
VTVEPGLGLLCFFPYRALESRVVAALAEAGFDDLTLAQARVAARIGESGTRLTALAEQAQVTKQTVGSLVDQLERAGYARRLPDPSDGRARLVCLADRGRAAVTVARRVEDQVEAEWTAHLGTETARGLREALTRLREVTDPWL